MRHPPRGLTAEEAALWARLAASVKPLHKNPPRNGEGDQPQAGGGASATPTAKPPPKFVKPPKRVALQPGTPVSAPLPVARVDNGGLDSHWERRMARASTAPDFTLDLHGCTLDQAHNRLDHGLAQARAMGARLVLVITGKPRPVEAADRGQRRGAIRAKLIDWLAAGPHGDAIAAVRPAQRRHGGEGALYLVLKRGA